MPRLDRTFSSKKRKLNQNHINELEGTTEAMHSGERAKHTAVTLLRADKKTTTARKLEQARQLRPD